MGSRDFAFWLQGFIELNGVNKLTQKQVQIIKNHLDMVFKHEIDPSMGDKEHQYELHEVHDFDPHNDMIMC
jgi:hypothetical protein